MSAPTPKQEVVPEFKDRSFDAAAFAAATLASWQTLAAVIDHTLLKPEATRELVVSLCNEAARYRFACVMVNPVWASTAVGALSGAASRPAAARWRCAPTARPGADLPENISKLRTPWKASTSKTGMSTPVHTRQCRCGRRTSGGGCCRVSPPGRTGTG